MTASDIGTSLMQALKDIADFDASAGNSFTTNLTSAQNTFLTGAIAQVGNVARDLNASTAANGYISNRLDDAQGQQTSMTTLYKGFVSNIQDTDMAKAATQLSLNQTQLQAALQVTAGLHQLSLLNYMTGG
jgi:flagellar hook-associated protein 3 FlgL